MDNVFRRDDKIGLKCADGKANWNAVRRTEPDLNAEGIELRVAGIYGNKLSRYLFPVDNEIGRNIGPQCENVRLSFPEHRNACVVDGIARDVAPL